MYSLIIRVLICSSVISSVTSIINNKYLTFYTPDYAKRYIYLEGKYSYSVQLILEKDHNQANVRNMSRENPVFIIKSPEFSYYGVMAIVQSIQLRTHPNGKCRDYLQFSPHPGGRNESNRIKQVCGSLSRGDDLNESRGLIGPRTFYNPKGSVKLEVHVDPDTDYETEIGAEIAFTAYTTCPGTDVGLKTLQACSDIEIMSCIPSSLFCDAKIDCGFSDGFAVDEANCYYPYLYGLIAVMLIALVVLSIYGFMHWVHLKVKRDSASA